MPRVKGTPVKKNASKSKMSVPRIRQMAPYAGRSKGSGSSVQVYNRYIEKPFTTIKWLKNHILYTGTNNAVSSALSDQIAIFPDISAFTAIFQYYKINSITYHFTWKEGGPTPLDLSTLQQPQIYCKDNFDSTATTAGAITQGSNARNTVMTPENPRFSFQHYPVTVSPVYLSAIANGYKVNPKQWIALAYQTVPHYGQLLYIDNIPIGSIVTVDIEMNVSFKVEG